MKIYSVLFWPARLKAWRDFGEEKLWDTTERDRILLLKMESWKASFRDDVISAAIETTL